MGKEEVKASSFLMWPRNCSFVHSHATGKTWFARETEGNLSLVNIVLCLPKILGGKKGELNVEEQWAVSLSNGFKNNLNQLEVIYN